MRFLLLILPVLLTGCAAMNSDFDCGVKPGVMCKSLDQVNAMIDQGELGGKEKTFDVPFKPGVPYRHSDTVMRIWIAPYEDVQGNYHQESVIYTVIKPGRWES